MAERIIQRDIKTEYRNDRIKYGIAVNRGRMIADFRDNMKPVQRRIIFTMYDGLKTHTRGNVKSARIVGDCMGKYHPHQFGAIR